MADRKTQTGVISLRRIGPRFIVVLLLLALAASVGWWAWTNKPTPPKSTATDAYADYGRSASCHACHAAEFAAWKGSHHAMAEREPDPAMDDAAFIPAKTLRAGTQQTTFQSNDGHYQLIAPGLNARDQTFVVDRILGHDPLRQMLVSIGDGRIQATEAAWDPHAKQWFDVYGDEDRKPGEWGHWLGRGMNWNSMCAVCHNTRVHKNYDAATDSYHTTMAEQSVTCESCHGPMKDHDTWQQAHKGTSTKDPTLHPLSRDQMLDTCAGCHSRRAEITGDFKPGDSYWDHHLLSIVDDSDLFYPDGQIHEEDYEFTAFLGSRMHNKGVRCIDCHEPHTMKTRVPGNFLCLSCHAAGSKTAPNIDPVSHSHHKVFGYDAKGVLVNADLTKYKPAEIAEKGGECVNCHMPQTVYMQRHWRHDHGFTIPDPLLTKEFGIPNACERCHADKGTDWNLSYVDKWYGAKMNRPYRQRAEILARAKRGDDSAREPLLNMLATKDIPYWQAVAAGMLQPWAADPKVSSALAAQLSHSDPLVRQMAARSLGPLAESGQPDIVVLLKPLLNDPSRNVRMVTAGHLAATLDPASAIGTEYQNFLAENCDQPLGQMQQGQFELTRGNVNGALAHFQTAVKWDPYSAPLRAELAVVLSQLGRNAETVKQLEEAVKLEPKNADMHFKLALALNETDEKDRMIGELEEAVRCDPRDARAWYNLGLARSQRGDVAGAIAALLQAESADPNDPRAPYARATILARMGRVEDAKAAARRALQLNPGFNDAAELLRQLGGQ